MIQCVLGTDDVFASCSLDIKGTTVLINTHHSNGFIVTAPLGCPSSLAKKSTKVYNGPRHTHGLEDQYLITICSELDIPSYKYVVYP